MVVFIQNIVQIFFNKSAAACNIPHHGIFSMFLTSIKGYNFILICQNLPICNPRTLLYNIDSHTKVSRGAKIRNQYNQVPHLTQDTNGKVTNSQLDTTNESQEVSPFPAGDHRAHIKRRAQRHSKQKTKQNIKDPQKKHLLGAVSKIFYWMA